MRGWLIVSTEDKILYLHKDHLFCMQNNPPADSECILYHFLTNEMCIPAMELLVNWQPRSFWVTRGWDLWQITLWCLKTDSLWRFVITLFVCAFIYLLCLETQVCFNISCVPIIISIIIHNVGEQHKELNWTWRTLGHFLHAEIWKPLSSSSCPEDVPRGHLHLSAPLAFRSIHALPDLSCCLMVFGGAGLHGR